MTLSEDHPQQDFIFFLRNDVSPKTLADLKATISSLANKREWTIAAPDFIQLESEESSLEGGLAGGRLAIYSALPPWGDRLPREVDRAHFEEVQEVVQALCELSNAKALEFQLELDGTVVGGIRNGEADKMLMQGLLEPWRSAVQ